MGNLKDVFYELLARMDKHQYESYEAIHTNILRERGKKLDNYEQFNLAAKILSQGKTTVRKPH